MAACSPARDDDGSGRPYRHFDRSGAEWRNLPLSWYGRHYGRRSLGSEHHGSGSCLCPITACGSARDDGGRGHPYRYFQKGTNDKNAAPIPVISTVAERSGEISRLHGQESIEEGDLSTQRIIGAIPICLPCRHAAPLEMTMLAGSIGHTCGVRVQRVV